MALALLLAACGESPQSALSPEGPFARRPDQLLRVVFWIAVVVFVLVQGLIIYSMVKFRRKPGDDALPVQTHGNTKLEITWTVIPALILAGIAVPTIQMVFELEAVPDQAFRAEVIGHRWWFEYRYPVQEQWGIDEELVTANELVIPAGVPVRLAMTAEESGSPAGGVLHSFWVPPLAGKQDMAPGRETAVNLLADEPGRYLGQCAEYCGLSHANMRIRVVAQEAADFREWVELQAAPAAEPEPGSLAAQGRDLIFTEQAGGNACASCHAVRGASVTQEGREVAALGAVGPDLTHLMSRKEFAGAIFDLYRRAPDGSFTDEPDIETMAAWLRNPNAMKPMQPEAGYGMPNLALTEAEIDALVAYLVTLE